MGYKLNVQLGNGMAFTAGILNTTKAETKLTEAFLCGNIDPWEIHVI